MRPVDSISIAEVHGACSQEVARLQAEISTLRMGCAAPDLLSELDDTLRVEVAQLRSLGDGKAGMGLAVGFTDGQASAEDASGASTPDDRTLQDDFVHLYGTGLQNERKSGPAPTALPASRATLEATPGACWDVLYGGTVTTAELADLSEIREAKREQSSMDAPASAQLPRHATKRFRRDSLTFEMVEDATDDVALLGFQVNIRRVLLARS